ncbi:MAG TPA: c-type cytochrome, partial [Pirellula sp.]|nr:c-type cytochrome [Pirellula sp.]
QGYNDSTPVINGEKQQSFRQGFWRFAVEPGLSDENAPVYRIENGKVSDERTNKFDPHSIRVSKLEFVRSTNNNTWGFGQSEEGLIYGSTANGTPSVFMPMANRYYERVNGWSPEVLQSMADSNNFNPITTNVRQVDWHGGYTAGCGHALYTARRYPKSWWNRVAFVCEPTGHLVGTFIIDRFGAGYQSKNPFNLVASNDEWAAPTMAEVGPDGNVWVLDWYNFIVQHNPTPQGFSTGNGNAYESDLRDKKHGRIYRVVYGGNDGLDKATQQTADQAVLNGLDASNETLLVGALRHPTMLWRKHAQRLLVEKGILANTTVQLLQSLVNDPSVDSNGLNAGAIHALWVLNATKPRKPVAVNSVQAEYKLEDALATAMKHKSEGVRRNALQVSANNLQTLELIMGTGILNDTDLQVRLAALLKIADIPHSKKELLEILSRPDLLTQVNAGTERKADRWLLDAWTSATAAHAKEILPRMITQKDWQPSTEVLKHIGIVAEHAARSRLDAAGVEQFILAPGNPNVASVIIKGLVAGWPKDYELSISKQAGDRLLSTWLNGSFPIESKSQVLQLATVFGVKDLGQGLGKIQQELVAVFGDPNKDTESRIAAAKQSIVLQPESNAIVSDVIAQVTPQSVPEFASGMVQVLGASKAKGLAGILAARSRTLPPDFLKNAIRVLLSRSQSTMEMLDLIEAGKLTLSDLQLDQKQALRSHPDATVRNRALAIMKSSGGVPNSDRQKVLDAWMSVTQEVGDASNGKLTYEKHCAACHKHGELGVNLGPNLTGMAVHPKPELLMNILDPSRSVEGNFRTYSIRTTDSVVLTGMLASESKTSIEIINAQGKKEVILRDDIEELIASQKSLMPEGFEGQISRTEMRDLLEFLASKGKYVPLPIDKVATSITTKGMFFDEKGTAERLVFNDWLPKTFQGVPFLLVDPQGDRVPNAIMLYGPNGNMAPTMPKQVDLTCHTSTVAIHLLSGIGGWSFPASTKGTVSMIVRLHYANGKTENHSLINGEHFADYIRRVDVPKSEFAFDVKGKQLRYLAIKPASRDPLARIELVKGPDNSAPIVMAITVQTVE